MRKGNAGGGGGVPALAVHTILNRAQNLFDRRDGEVYDIISPKPLAGQRVREALVRTELSR